jgi:hypothetical protein
LVWHAIPKKPGGAQPFPFPSFPIGLPPVSEMRYSAELCLGYYFLPWYTSFSQLSAINDIDLEIVLRPSCG